MNSYSFSTMSNVLWGSHIRIFELTHHLKTKLFHGSGKERLLKFPLRYPQILIDDQILLFGYNPFKFELEFLSVNKKDIIFDVADIPYLQTKYFGGNGKNIKQENNFLDIIKASNKILLISPSLKDLMNVDISKKEVLFVSNASNPNFFKNTPINMSNIMTVLCVTGYAKGRGIEKLINAFDMLKDKNNKQLKLVGHNMPISFESENVVVVRDKFYKDMPDVFSECYLTVIPHDKNRYMDAALPLKLFDSMASARPVIVTDCDEMASLVNDEKCGIVVEDSAKGISGAINYLCENTEEAKKMGINGREAIEKKHSWENRASLIQSFIKK